MLSFKRGNRTGVLVAAFACALCGAFSVGDSATAAVPPLIHTLPGRDSISQHRSVFGQDVRVRPARTLYAGGVADVAPAHAIDVYSVVGSWSSAHPAVLPDSMKQFVRKIGSPVQFFNTSMGWIVVPGNWTLWHAFDAVNGSLRYEFTAASGPRDGWMIVSMCSAGFGGCNRYSVAGLLPKGDFGTDQNPIQSELGIPAHVLLRPTPKSIDHPYPCTALFKYSKTQMSVNGAVYLDEYKDWFAASFFIGLPKGHSQLGRDLAIAFLRLRSQEFPFYCAMTPQAADKRASG